MKNIYLSVLLAAIILVACNKSNEVKPVDFTVSSSKINGTAASSFSTKDTVLFNISGNPDQITFYSGEPGKRYDYINRTSAKGTPQLQFSTVRANGTQSNSLALLISTDFKGVATKTIYGVLTRDTIGTNANIAAATWIDITSKATLSTGATTAVPSGIIDLSAYVGKPVYIAFKYNATNGSIQNKWTITGLSVNNVLADGTSYTVASLNGPTTAITNYGNSSYGPGWAVSFDPAKNVNGYGWVYTDKTSLVITGAATATTATASAEAWAIMGAIDLTKVTPDLGAAIKMISAKLPSFTYNYTTAGTYNAVFVGTNITPEHSSAQVQKSTITITP